MQRRRDGTGKDHAADGVGGADRNAEVETAGAHAFGSSPLAVAITEGEHHVLRYVNAAWLELVDDGASGLGRPFAEHRPELATIEKKLLDRVFQDGEPERIVDARFMDAGSERCLTITAWPWENAVAGSGLIVIELEETTGEAHERDRIDQLAGELRRVNERLVVSGVREQERSTDRAEKLAGAEEANRAKSAMISSVSHELRTPLTALLGYLDLIAEGIAGPVTEKQTDMLGRMKIAGLHLLRTVEQILTYSRTEAGQLTVHPEPVDVCSLVRETATLMEPILKSKSGLAFQLRTPRKPIVMETDPALVRQILINLLTNAVKFTDAGEIRLEIAQDGNDFTCVVSDTGIGIAPKDMERIFEPFQRGDQDRVVQEEGSGLGLAVSRRLARLLGGDVTVNSKLGSGSTFTLRCPLHAQQASSAAA